MVHHDPDSQESQHGPTSHHEAKAEHDQCEGHPLGIAGDLIQSFRNWFSQGCDIKAVQGVEEASLTDQSQNKADPEDRLPNLEWCEEDQDQGCQCKR